MNLRPPCATVSTHTATFNAVAFQSPAAMPKAWTSLCTQSVHSFSFPPRALRTAPSRFSKTVRFGRRPALYQVLYYYEAQGVSFQWEMCPHEILRPRLGTLAARYRVGLTGCPAGVSSGVRRVVACSPLR